MKWLFTEYTPRDTDINAVSKEAIYLQHLSVKLEVIDNLLFKVRYFNFLPSK